METTNVRNLNIDENPKQSNNWIWS